MTRSSGLLSRVMAVFRGDDIAERDRLISEKDAVLSERAIILSQRDECLSQRNELISQREVLTAQRDEYVERIKADAMRIYNARKSYLDLMEATLIGAIHEDPPLEKFGWTHYDPAIRHVGLDWPRSALSMIGAARMHNFRYLIERAIFENIPGDIVETGVWRGGAGILARAVLKSHELTDRKVILADSFEGLPPPDGEKYPADKESHFHEFPELAISLEQVRSNFDRFGLLDEQVVFVKGWFKDTMKTMPTNQISVLRLDGDMYESTIDPLRHLFDRVSPGGWIIVDDYGVVDACKAAVTDFLDQRSLKVDPLPIDGFGVYFQKPPQ
jgi:hypothetical protein